MLVAAVALAGGLAVQASQTATTARVAGRVVAAGTNAPIADARVVLIPTMRPAPPLSLSPPPQAITDQNGRFVFEGLSPGTFHIDVQKPGFAPFSSPADGTPPATLNVTAGQAVDNLTLTLKKGGAISGRVLDAKGEPLASARVVALAHVQRGRGPVRWVPVGMSSNGATNDLGEFRLFGLAPGEYIVGASPNRGGPFGAATTPSRTTLATTYYAGTIDQNTALSVTVSADATLENITISMQAVPAFTVSGVVVDTDGAPVSGAMVMMMPAAPGGAFGGPGGDTRTDQSGAFVVNGVAPGTYRVMASVPVVTRPTQSGSGVVAGYTFVSGDSGTVRRPIEVSVTDTDVAGVRVVVDRP